MLIEERKKNAGLLDNVVIPIQNGWFFYLHETQNDITNPASKDDKKNTERGK